MEEKSSNSQIDPLRILANVTHELKTPLHSILTVASLLKSESDGPLSPEQQKQVDIILRNGERLLSLITDLLAFSTEKDQISVSPLALPNIIKGVTLRLSPLAEKGEVKINTFFPDKEEVFYSDEKLITLILDNILTNAVKFSGIRGDVEVYYRYLDPISYQSIRKTEEATTSGLEIVISDSGIGIDPLAKENIFKEFYQADSGNTRKFGGVGLGLSLVNNAVSKLGGEIQLQSELGSGSIFKIIIPNLESSYVKPSILVVGDDQLLVDAIRLILLDELFTFSSVGQDFSPSIIAENKTDVIILDLNDGLLVENSSFKRVENSELLKNIPVLGLSSSFDPAERAKYLSACQITDILVKPFQKEELLLKIKLLLA